MARPRLELHKQRPPRRQLPERCSLQPTPTVTDAPLHFKAVSVRLQPGEKSSVVSARRRPLQLSGSTEVSLDGETKMLNAGEGAIYRQRKDTALTAVPGRRRLSSISFLSPAADLVDLPRRHLPL